MRCHMCMCVYIYISLSLFIAEVCVGITSCDPDRCASGVRACRWRAVRRCHSQILFALAFLVKHMGFSDLGIPKATVFLHRFLEDQLWSAPNEKQLFETVVPSPKW